MKVGTKSASGVLAKGGQMGGAPKSGKHPAPMPKKPVDGHKPGQHTPMTGIKSR